MRHVKRCARTRVGVPDLAFLLHHQIFSSQLTSQDLSFTEHLLLWEDERRGYQLKAEVEFKPSSWCPEACDLNPDVPSLPVFISTSQFSLPLWSRSFPSPRWQIFFFSPVIWTVLTKQHIFFFGIIWNIHSHYCVLCFWSKKKKKKGECKHYVFPRFNLHKLHIRWSRRKKALCLAETKTM